MAESTPTFRRSLLLEILAAIIIVFFIQPIFVKLWSWLVWIGSNSYIGWMNSIYRNASLGDRNWLDVVVFTFAMLVISFGVVALLWRNFIFEKVDMINDKVINKIHPTINLIIRIILSILIIFSFINVSFSAFVDLQLNAPFQQRLSVLAPSITDQQSEELTAEWANMSTRSDFELIVTHMDALAHENNIELPDLLLK